MATTWALTFDCNSPVEQAKFWKAALDYADAPPPSGFTSWTDWLIACDVPEDEWDDGAAICDPTGEGPQISMLKVPEGKIAKNRIHLDLKVGLGRNQPAHLRRQRIEEKVGLLMRLGASELARHCINGELDHVVLADPEGNEFCVV
ncbi:glyoxalase [Arthrobacter sp. MYb211]|uniref:VOC family protein n=1 Tax=Micrococcaceae TaxID=1268 RepID=UPI000CFACCF5|nr:MULTISPECIES: VOC family protein [unclassified Arthrobacter]PRA01297.1 glyoxalase [Arthrobacter sp. MYb224]PRA12558.1 glyoxalase [Arthrobacter sp. MYb221]PRC09923.1 glyoxalase [Arthrobacter sp. MYb211]